MRADSAVGRIVGALSRRSPAIQAYDNEDLPDLSHLNFSYLSHENLDYQRKWQRNNALGRLVAALARTETIFDSSEISDLSSEDRFHSTLGDRSARTGHNNGNGKAALGDKIRDNPTPARQRRQIAAMPGSRRTKSDDALKVGTALLTLRTAVILFGAVIIGGTAGILVVLTGKTPVTAVLAGISAFAGGLKLLNALIE